MIKDTSCRLLDESLGVGGHLCNKGIAILVVWHFLVDHEEIDAGSQEVDGRCLDVSTVERVTCVFSTDRKSVV